MCFTYISILYIFPSVVNGMNGEDPATDVSAAVHFTRLAPDLNHGQTVSTVVNEFFSCHSESIHNHPFFVLNRKGSQLQHGYFFCNYNLPRGI